MALRKAIPIIEEMIEKDTFYMNGDSSKFVTFKKVKDVWYYFLPYINRNLQVSLVSKKSGIYLSCSVIHWYEKVGRTGISDETLLYIEINNVPYKGYKLSLSGVHTLSQSEVSNSKKWLFAPEKDSKHLVLSEMWYGDPWFPLTWDYYQNDNFLTIFGKTSTLSTFLSEK